METLIEILKNVGVAFGIIVVGWITAPLIARRIVKVSNRTNEQSLLTFVASYVQLMIKIAAIVISLSYLGLNMNFIVGSISAVGVGVSLALKDNMAAIAAGITIVFTKPFEIGDYIKVEDSEGYVTRIEISYVVLQTYSHQEVIIPNNIAIQKLVTNYSRDTKRRIHVEFPIGFDADIDTCISEFMDTLNECVYLIKDDEIKVVVERIDKECIIIGIFCWTLLDDYWNGLYDVNRRLQAKREENNISVPYTMIKGSH